MGEKDYLGRGMKFPPQVNAATGRFVTVSEEDAVRQALYLILTTQVTERPLRPGFGSTLMGYSFMDINQSTVNMVTRMVTEQIMKNEPRVSEVRVTADTTSRAGVVLFNIAYTVSRTGTPDNLVFPFYLNRQTEEEAEREAERYEPELIEEVVG